MQVYRKITSFFKKIGSSLLEVAFTIVPNTNGTRSLGSTTKKWGSVYANQYYGSGAFLTDLPGGGMADIIEDITPQLGGDLDVNGKNIIGTNLNLHTNTGGIAVQISSGAFYFNRPVYFYAHNSFDIGTPTVTAKNIYANQFHGDGSNLTGLPGGGMADIVEDLTPQLGGDLDTNGNKVTSTAWTELDGTSGIRLRSGGSMKMNIGAVGVQPMANVIPNVGGAYDLGVSGYGFKQVHATSFHGDGSNLTNLPAPVVDFVNIDSALYPSSTNVYNLGSTSKQWRYIYLQHMKLWYLGIIPNTDIELDLGASDKRFKDIFGQNIYATQVDSNTLNASSMMTLRVGGASQMTIGSSFNQSHNKFYPNTNGTLDLGQEANQWANMYAVNVHGSSKIHRTQMTWAMTGADRTLADSEHGTRIAVSSNGTYTNIILPVTTKKMEVEFYIGDAYDYTFIGDGTSVVRSCGSKFRSEGQYGIVRAHNNGGNVWVITGDLKV